MVHLGRDDPDGEQGCEKPQRATHCPETVESGHDGCDGEDHALVGDSVGTLGIRRDQRNESGHRHRGHESSAPWTARGAVRVAGPVSGSKRPRIERSGGPISGVVVAWAVIGV